MKNRILIVLGIGCAFFSMLFTACNSCQKDADNGELSGKVMVDENFTWPPDTAFSDISWPPDTIFISLYSEYGKSTDTKFIAKCYPPDTCFYRLKDVPFGNYFLAAVLVDKPLTKIRDRDGAPIVLSYYSKEVNWNSDPADIKNATPIELNKNNPKIDDLNIIIRNKPETER